MSEAEPIPPTSSVTALRIPMNQKCSAPKTSLAANAKRNNEKALNILLSTIPDRHLLSFHEAEDCITLCVSHKSRLGVCYKDVEDNRLMNWSFDDLRTTRLKVTLKQSTADPENIPKGYTQAASSKVQTAPNCASHSDEIICSFFAQQASMPTTHDDEDLLQIDEDAMEEIDIRWQVAMITARIRKFMRKTGRPIDLKPKNGITFDKSKIECFNCQKLGHFARECRFAKYQENRANGRRKDNNEEIDWTKEFDAEPVTFAMMALTKVDVKMIDAPSLDGYKLEYLTVQMAHPEEEYKEYVIIDVGLLLDSRQEQGQSFREPLEYAPYGFIVDLFQEEVKGKSTALWSPDDCKNKLRHKVKTIMCDHGTKFKNHLMNEFCTKKGIKREYSIARTPQQNGVAERKTRTLIGSRLEQMLQTHYFTYFQFWAEAFNTAYQLGSLMAEQRRLSVGITLLAAKENQKGKGPDWMFDLELLTPSMNYIPVRKENYADSGGKVSTYDDVEDLDDQQFIVHGPSINAAQNKHSEVHTDDNVADLLTKGFDLARFNFLVVTIGMMNP
ncbi:ribonuclease H-like domain-containing protein [Tanacetum coccineum]